MSRSLYGGSHVPHMHPGFCSYCLFVAQPSSSVTSLLMLPVILACVGSPANWYVSATRPSSFASPTRTAWVLVRGTSFLTDVPPTCATGRLHIRITNKASIACVLLSPAMLWQAAISTKQRRPPTWTLLLLCTPSLTLVPLSVLKPSLPRDLCLPMTPLQLSIG